MSFESYRYVQYSSYCTIYKPAVHIWDKEIHVHTAEELLLITGDGNCTMVSNGNTLVLAAPVLIWNRIGSFHAVTQMDPGLSVREAAFQPEIFSKTPAHFLRTEFLEDHAFFAIPLKPVQTERMLQLFDTLFKSPQFQRQLILPCIFHQITLYLSAGTEPIRCGAADNYIFEVVKLLQSAESERITIPELAARFNVGTTKLKSDFKRITGQTIHSFQMQVRVHAAWRMLSSTKLPLAQIAAHCGFTDESHLIRVFRKNIGTTPTSWRKTYKNRWSE